MNVFEWLTLGLALASLGISSLALVKIVNRKPTPALECAPSPAALPASSPLEGLTVVLAISQDHPHSVFANLLSEGLRRMDVETSSIPAEEITEFLQRWESEPELCDLVIAGAVTCNGYAEMYFRADLSCRTSSETIYSVLENPATGDRQANLAKEFISRTEAEISKRLSRAERRQALRELSGG